MKLRTISIIAGGVILVLVSIFAFIFILHAPANTRVETPETDVEVAISDDLSISSQILSFVDEGNGSYLIQYQYTLAHAGNYPALNLTANSWFNDTSLNTFQVISLTTNSALTLNPGFDGRTDRSLLAGNNFLSPNSSAQIILTVRLSYGDISRQFINFVDTAGDAGSASSSSSQTASSTSSSSSSSSSSSVSITSSSSSSATSTPSTGTGSTSKPTISTTSPSAAPAPSSSSRSTTVTISLPTSSLGSGGTDNSLYDADQVTFPLSPLQSSSTTTSVFVGKGP